MSPEAGIHPDIASAETETAEQVELESGIVAEETVTITYVRTENGTFAILEEDGIAEEVPLAETLPEPIRPYYTKMIDEGSTEWLDKIPELDQDNKTAYLQMSVSGDESGQESLTYKIMLKEIREDGSYATKIRIIEGKYHKFDNKANEWVPYEDKLEGEWLEKYNDMVSKGETSFRVRAEHHDRDGEEAYEEVHFQENEHGELEAVFSPPIYEQIEKKDEYEEESAGDIDLSPTLDEAVPSSPPHTISAAVHAEPSPADQAKDTPGAEQPPIATATNGPQALQPGVSSNVRGGEYTAVQAEPANGPKSGAAEGSPSNTTHTQIQHEAATAPVQPQAPITSIEPKPPIASPTPEAVVSTPAASEPTPMEQDRQTATQAQPGAQPIRTATPAQPTGMSTQPHAPAPHSESAPYLETPDPSPETGSADAASEFESHTVVTAPDTLAATAIPGSNSPAPTSPKPDGGGGGGVHAETSASTPPEAKTEAPTEASTDADTSTETPASAQKTASTPIQATTAPVKATQTTQPAAARHEAPPVKAEAAGTKTEAPAQTTYAEAPVLIQPEARPTTTTQHETSHQEAQAQKPTETPITKKVETPLKATYIESTVARAEAPAQTTTEVTAPTQKTEESPTHAQNTEYAAPIQVKADKPAEPITIQAESPKLDIAQEAPADPIQAVDAKTDDGHILEVKIPPAQSAIKETTRSRVNEISQTEVTTPETVAPDEAAIEVPVQDYEAPAVQNQTQTNMQTSSISNHAKAQTAPDSNWANDFGATTTTEPATFSWGRGDASPHSSEARNGTHEGVSSRQSSSTSYTQDDPLDMGDFEITIEAGAPEHSRAPRRATHKRTARV